MENIFDGEEYAGISLADLTLRVIEMERNQLSFQETMYEFVASMYGDLQDLVINLVGQTMGDLVAQIPYVGPILAPLVRTLTNQAPSLVSNGYSGYNL